MEVCPYLSHPPTPCASLLTLPSTSSPSHILPLTHIPLPNTLPPHLTSHTAGTGSRCNRETSSDGNRERHHPRPCGAVQGEQRSPPSLHTHTHTHKPHPQAQAEKDRKMAETIAEMRKSFYCDLCDKQYTKYSEYDNHLNSYDHHHRQVPQYTIVYSLYISVYHSLQSVYLSIP